MILRIGAITLTALAFAIVVGLAMTTGGGQAQATDNTPTPTPEATATPTPEPFPTPEACSTPTAHVIDSAPLRPLRRVLGRKHQYPNHQPLPAEGHRHGTPGIAGTWKTTYHHLHSRPRRLQRQGRRDHLPRAGRRRPERERERRDELRKVAHPVPGRQGHGRKRDHRGHGDRQAIRTR